MRTNESTGSQMTRTGVPAIVVLSLGLLLSSCHDDNRNTSSPVMPPEEKSAPAPGEATEPANPTAGRKPAVVFVAFEVTPQDVVERMLKIAAVTRRDVVYDLGCGDGRIVITAARKYGCRAVGYDLDPLRVQEARESARKNRVADLITVEEKDVLKADLREASVVALYLGTELNARLIPQLRTLQPGSRIVSHDYGLDKIPPDKVVEMVSRADNRKHTLYLWTCPLPPAGN